MSRILRVVGQTADEPGVADQQPAARVGAAEVGGIPAAAESPEQRLFRILNRSMAEYASEDPAPTFRRRTEIQGEAIDALRHYFTEKLAAQRKRKTR